MNVKITKAVSEQAKIENCKAPKLSRVDELGFWRCKNCGGYYFSTGGKIEGPMTRLAYEQARARMGEPVLEDEDRDGAEERAQDFKLRHAREMRRSV